METTIPESALSSVLQQQQGISTTPRRVVTAPIAYTVVAEDNKALIQCAVDATVVSLPTGLAKGFSVTVQNTGADAAALVSISPAATHAALRDRAARAWGSRSDRRARPGR